MNDLDLVRRLRADIPTPAPARLGPGRARLLAAMRKPPARPVRRFVLPVGVVTAVAAGAAVVVLGTGGADGVAAPPAQLTLTAQLLNTASTTVAQRTVVEPAPAQWLYTRSASLNFGQPTEFDDNWIRFDASQSAYYEGSKLKVHTSPVAPKPTTSTALDVWDSYATPMTAYNALASLPTDPKALLAAVDHQLSKLGSDATPPWFGRPTNHGQVQFDYLAELLWNAATGAPPAAEAAVFRTMATIPGVTSQRDITDVVGRAAVGLSDNDNRSQLLLDPTTYQVIGQRQVSTGVSPKGEGGPVVPKGAVESATTWVQVTPVSAPGQR
jgi:hypothetical protein